MTNSSTSAKTYSLLKNRKSPIASSLSFEIPLSNYSIWIQNISTYRLFHDGIWGKWILWQNIPVKAKILPLFINQTFVGTISSRVSPEIYSAAISKQKIELDMLQWDAMVFSIIGEYVGGSVNACNNSNCNDFQGQSLEKLKQFPFFRAIYTSCLKKSNNFEKISKNQSCTFSENGIDYSAYISIEKMKQFDENWAFVIIATYSSMYSETVIHANVIVSIAFLMNFFSASVQVLLLNSLIESFEKIQTFANKFLKRYICEEKETDCLVLKWVHCNTQKSRNDPFAKKTDTEFFQEIDNFRSTFFLLHKVIMAHEMFIPPSLIKRISKQEPQVSEIHERQSIAAIVYVDIERASEFVETLSSDRIIVLFGRYFEMLLDTVKKHDGSIADLQSDSFLCFFESEENVAKISTNGFNFIMDVQKSMRKLKTVLRTLGLPGLILRITAHLGSVNFGNFGSQDLMKSSVFGDIFRDTNRMRSVGSKLNVHTICTSDFLSDACSTVPLGRPLVKIMMTKGISTIWELGVDKIISDAKYADFMDIFESFYSPSLNWNDTLSKQTFIDKCNEFLDTYPNDKPAMEFLQVLKDQKDKILNIVDFPFLI